jgi:hypothetical protein
MAKVQVADLAAQVVELRRQVGEALTQASACEVRAYTAALTAELERDHPGFTYDPKTRALVPRPAR